LSGRFMYTTIGQSMKQQNSEPQRAAKARNSIALAHLHSASLHCRGRRLVHFHAAARSLEGAASARDLTAAPLFINEVSQVETASLGAEEGFRAEARRLF